MSMQKRAPANRRRRAIVGAIGMAAVLGTGAYVVTAQLTGQDASISSLPVGRPASEHPAQGQTDPKQPFPERPFPQQTVPEPPTSAATPSKRAAERTARPSPAGEAKRKTSPTPDEAAARQRIKAAREAAAKAGFPVQRPRTPARGAAQVKDVIETTRALPDGGTIRVITGKGDLGGHREMLWAADNGTAVNGARCTQKFNFSRNGTAAVRPTMLLCWRTSATKSVVTVLVDSDGKPSKKESAAIIAREWAKLR